jgi:hypothetical protein
VAKVKMMQRLRYLFCRFILIIAAIVLSACTTSQATHSVSTAIPTRGNSNFQASRTPFVTRTQKIDRKAITPMPTLSMTPTFNVKDYTNSWARFYDHVYGITIEYPSIYSEKPYQVACDPYETRDGIHFGANSKVFIRQQLGESLDEHIAAFIPYYHSDEQFKLESQEAVQVNNQPAIAITYKLGDTTENRELVFVTAPESKIIYTFSFIDGSACDVPELGLSERTVFEHALETFYVEK